MNNQIKISQLPINSTPSNLDVFPIVNSGTTKQITLSGLTNFINENYVITGNTLIGITNTNSGLTSSNWYIDSNGDLSGASLLLKTNSRNSTLEIGDVSGEDWGSHIRLTRGSSSEYIDSRISVASDGMIFKNFDSIDGETMFSFRDANDLHLWDLILGGRNLFNGAEDDGISAVQISGNLKATSGFSSDNGLVYSDGQGNWNFLNGFYLGDNHSGTGLSINQSENVTIMGDWQNSNNGTVLVVADNTEGKIVFIGAEGGLVINGNSTIGNDNGNLGSNNSIYWDDYYVSFSNGALELSGNGVLSTNGWSIDLNGQFSFDDGSITSDGNGNVISNSLTIENNGFIKFYGDYGTSAQIDSSNGSVYFDNGGIISDGGGNLNIESIRLPNDAYFSEGTYDTGRGGNNGASIYCSLGYELNWQSGYLRNIQTGGNGTPYPLLLDSEIIYSELVSNTPTTEKSLVTQEWVNSQLISNSLLGLISDGTGSIGASNGNWVINDDGTAVFYDSQVLIQDNYLAVQNQVFFGYGQNAGLMGSEGNSVLGDWNSQGNGSLLIVDDDSEQLNFNKALSLLNEGRSGISTPNSYQTVLGTPYDIADGTQILIDDNAEYIQFFCYDWYETPIAQFNGNGGGSLANGAFVWNNDGSFGLYNESWWVDASGHLYATDNEGNGYSEVANKNWVEAQGYSTGGGGYTPSFDDNGGGNISVTTLNLPVSYLNYDGSAWFGEPNFLSWDNEGNLTANSLYTSEGAFQVDASGNLTINTISTGGSVYLDRNGNGYVGGGNLGFYNGGIFNSTGGYPYSPSGLWGISGIDGSVSFDNGAISSNGGGNISAISFNIDGSSEGLENTNIGVYGISTPSLQITGEESNGITVGSGLINSFDGGSFNTDGSGNVTVNSIKLSSFTSTEMNAITNPQVGTMIYNTTWDAPAVYSSTGWKSFSFN